MGRWTLHLRGVLISITSLERWWPLPQWGHSQGKCQVGIRCLFTTAHLWVLNFSTCLDCVGANQPFGSASHWDDASSRLPPCFLQLVLPQQGSKSAAGWQTSARCCLCLSPIPAARCAFLSAALHSAHKESGSNPFSSMKLCFSPNNSA